VDEGTDLLRSESAPKNTNVSGTRSRRRDTSCAEDHEELDIGSEDNEEADLFVPEASRTATTPSQPVNESVRDQGATQARSGQRSLLLRVVHLLYSSFLLQVPTEVD
jgi:hypothetical protein